MSWPGRFVPRARERRYFSTTERGVFVSQVSPGENGLALAGSSSAAMRAVYADSALIEAMLRFEGALALAEAEHGIVPLALAKIINDVAGSMTIDREALAAQAPAAGNLAIPLVKQLTAAVTVKDSAAAGFVHWGATSQDVIDSGAMLQARSALQILLGDLAKINAALARLASEHAATVMAGRTWLQHATPVSLGLKAAGWLHAVRGATGKLEALEKSLPLQLGGASGTLAALGEDGDVVTDSLSRLLSLSRPLLPWHAARQPITDLGSALALTTGVLGKIARDVSLMMQNEIAEVSEPRAAGKGGSSTMAHKRNPVGCATTLAAAQRAPQLLATLYAALVGEHERGLGGWQSEWSVLPELFLVTSGAAEAMGTVLGGLEVDRERIAANLLADKGLSMAEAATFALARRLDRGTAQRIVERAIKATRGSDKTFLEALTELSEVAAVIEPDVLATILAPNAYLGRNSQMIERVLKDYRDSVKGKGVHADD